MPYIITQYTKDKAKKLGVRVETSLVQGKKIDVYNKADKKVASIGQFGAGDYPTYMKTKGKAFARERRRLYRIRHAGENMDTGSPGFYAWHLLW